MSETIPLFPLGSVLLPGMPLSLHIFEERYRELIRGLLTLPEPTDRKFGVVAIRPGWEVGTCGLRALYPVGCTAEVREVSRYQDGRYDLVVVGVQRFRLIDLDEISSPYLRCEIEWLRSDGPPDERGRALARTATDLYSRYMSAMALVRDAQIPPPVLPEEPTSLSCLIASTALLDLDERQTLLEQPTANARLRAEISLLAREIAMLRELRAVPIPLADLPAPQSPN